jgi:tetratricopeptide (TPR) repeat protein
MRKLSGKILALVGLAISIWGLASAFKSGASSLLVVVARAQALSDQETGLQTAQKAISFNSRNPSTHLAKAGILLSQRKHAQVKAEMEETIKLLPKDYFLWLELGRARDFANDSKEAIEATRRAQKLAPFYSDVSWQLGNSLIRAGQPEEGFEELRRSALSDSTLWPALIDMAGGLLGEVESIEKTLKPEGHAAFYAFARFYAKHNRPKEALRCYQNASDKSPDENTLFLADLFNGGHFAAARQVWVESEGKSYITVGNQISNPGFEADILQDERWFGWRLLNMPAAFNAAVDSSKPAKEKRSLRLDFSGEVPIGSAYLYQYVTVQPGRSYQLHLSIRAQELVSGGLPVLYIVEPGGENRQVLGVYDGFTSGASDWRNISLKFKASPRYEAVTIELQRKGCPVPQCPIFGKLWLDDFRLVEEE